MSRRSPAPLAAVALTTVLALTGCVGQTTYTDPENPVTGRSDMSQTQTPVKEGDPTVRHDVEPLTKRFSALGTPVSATWRSGTLSGSAPGPSTYWIDAVVELSPAAAQALRATNPTASGSTLDVVDEVRAAIPAGTLLGGGALDAAFAQGTFRAHAHLVDGTDTVVLAALGQ